MSAPVFGQSFLPRLLLLALVGAARPAVAQVAASTTEKELGIKLPQLPEGGGDKAIVQAIRLGVRYPNSALRDRAQGQSVVSFAVSPSGQVCLIKMLKPLRPDLDSAVVQSVRQLPRLRPAEQAGRPVACLMQAPVTFLIDNAPRLPGKPLPALDSSQVYATVTQMPVYQGQTGYQQLATAWVAEYLRLSRPGGCAIPRLNMALTATVGPSGTLYDVQIMQSDGGQYAALQARFGDQAVRVPYNQADQFDEACLPQLLAAARHLPRLTPAYLYGQPAATRIFLSMFNPSYRY